MSYQPKPIDTSSVTLDTPVLALTERLAEHAHDLWALRRLNEGWTLGPKRDDAVKTHPCLVPYDAASGVARSNTTARRRWRR